MYTSAWAIQHCKRGKAAAQAQFRCTHFCRVPSWARKQSHSSHCRQLLQIAALTVARAAATADLAHAITQVLALQLSTPVSSV